MKRIIKLPRQETVRASKLADFFGKQIEKNQQQAKCKPWTLEIEHTMERLRGAKKGEFKSIAFTTGPALAREVDEAARQVAKEWNLEPWQAKSAIISLTLKFAFGKVGG